MKKGLRLLQALFVLAHWLVGMGPFAVHAAAIEEVLLANYQLQRGQLDALWSYVGKKAKKATPRLKQVVSSLAFRQDRLAVNDD